MTTTRRSRLTLRVVALAYVLGLLALPILVILYRTFEPGLDTFIASIRTPAAISALNLSLTIVAIVVPLNVVFGVVTAIALVRWRVPGRGLDPGRRRPAVRGLADRGRRLADHAVGRVRAGSAGSRAPPASRSSSACPAWCSRPCS